MVFVQSSGATSARNSNLQDKPSLIHDVAMSVVTSVITRIVTYQCSKTRPHFPRRGGVDSPQTVQALHYGVLV